jgi:hypothetical protein
VVRVTTNLVALYTFEEGGGGMVGDTSGVGPPLNLFIFGLPSDITWITDVNNGGGLSINNAIITSPGPATKIIGAGKINNAITIEAWIVPSITSTNPNGGRIVSISGDVSNRNVTLNQVDAEYSARIRTLLTDNDGNPPLNSTGTALAAAELTHVVFTRAADGTSTLYVKRSGLDVSFTQTTTGILANWDDSYPLIFGNESSLNRSWQGTYYLVAIYGRALTAGEVLQNFNAGPK